MGSPFQVVNLFDEEEEQPQAGGSFGYDSPEPEGFQGTQQGAPGVVNLFDDEPKESDTGLSEEQLRIKKNLEAARKVAQPTSIERDYAAEQKRRATNPTVGEYVWDAGRGLVRRVGEVAGSLGRGVDTAVKVAGHTMALGRGGDPLRPFNLSPEAQAEYAKAQGAKSAPQEKALGVHAGDVTGAVGLSEAAATTPTLGTEGAEAVFGAPTEGEGYGRAVGRAATAFAGDVVRDPFSLGKTLSLAGKAGAGAKALGVAEKIADPAFKAVMAEGTAAALEQMTDEYLSRGFTPQAAAALATAVLSGGAMGVEHFAKKAGETARVNEGRARQEAAARKAALGDEEVARMREIREPEAPAPEADPGPSVPGDLEARLAAWERRMAGDEGQAAPPPEIATTGRERDVRPVREGVSLIEAPQEAGSAASAERLLRLREIAGGREVPAQRTLSEANLEGTPLAEALPERAPEVGRLETVTPETGVAARTAPIREALQGKDVSDAALRLVLPERHGGDVEAYQRDLDAALAKAEERMRTTKAGTKAREAAVARHGDLTDQMVERAQQLRRAAGEGAKDEVDADLLAMAGALNKKGEGNQRTLIRGRGNETEVVDSGGWSPKDQFGLSDMDASGPELARAIYVDKDNPLYLELRQRAQALRDEHGVSRETPGETPLERRSPERLAGSFHDWHERMRALPPEQQQAALAELHNTAYRDNLTELPNRAAFMVSESAPENAGKSRTSWDVEGLKWANDTYGHEAGDHILKAVAQAMREAGIDGYRVGGDEFWSLDSTPDAAASNIAKVNQRLADALIHVETPDGRQVTLKGIRAWAASGADIAGAERGLLAVKENAVQGGQRAGRGERPRSLSEVPPAGESNRGGEPPADYTGSAADLRRELGKVERPGLAQKGQGPLFDEVARDQEFQQQSEAAEALRREQAGRETEARERAAQRTLPGDDVDTALRNMRTITEESARTPEAFGLGTATKLAREAVRLGLGYLKRGVTEREQWKAEVKKNLPGLDNRQLDEIYTRAEQAFKVTDKRRVDAEGNAKETPKAVQEQAVQKAQASRQVPTVEEARRVWATLEDVSKPNDPGAGPGDAALKIKERLVKPFLENLQRIPGGKPLYEKATAYLADHEGHTSRQSAAIMNGLRRLSASEQTYLVDWLEGRDNLMELGRDRANAVRRVGQIARAVMNDVAKRADQQGVFTGFRQNYFPHMFEKPFEWKEVVQRYADREKISFEEATKELNRASSLRGANKQANLEKFRSENELTNYRKDAGALLDYIDQANRRIAQAKHFGKSNEGASGIYDAMPKWDRQYAKTGFERMLNLEESKLWHKPLQQYRKFSAFTRLAWGAPTQLTTIAQVVGQSSTRKAMRGMIDAADSIAKMGPSEIRAMRNGSLYQNLSSDMHAIAADAPGRGPLKNFIWGVGTVDKKMRVLASRVAERTVPDMLKAGDFKELTRAFGVQNPEKLAEVRKNWEKATPSQKAAYHRAVRDAGRFFSEKTQYRTDVSHMPLWMTSQPGRTATQFLSFAYQQARFVDQLVKSGDKRRLAKYMLVAAPLMGEVASDLKAIMKGYGVTGEPVDEKDESEEIDKLARVFGSKRIKIQTDKGSKILVRDAGLRYLQDLLTAGGVGIFQTIIERGLLTKDYRGALGGPILQDALAAFELGSEGAKAVTGTALQAAAGKPSGDKLKAFGQKAGATATRTLVPGIGGQLASEFMSSKEPPARPGWVGRVRDVASGEATIPEAVSGGVVTSAPPSKARKMTQELGEARTTNKSLQSEQDRQFGNLSEPKTPEEKLAAAKNKTTRLEARGRILTALRDGNLPLARFYNRQLRREKLQQFDLDRMQAVLKSLEDE